MWLYKSNKSRHIWLWPLDLWPSELEHPFSIREYFYGKGFCNFNMRNPIDPVCVVLTWTLSENTRKRWKYNYKFVDKNKYKPVGSIAYDHFWPKKGNESFVVIKLQKVVRRTTRSNKHRALICLTSCQMCRSNCLYVELAEQFEFSCSLFRCQKLPRALKDWQEYKDLCQQIDDFNALMPLLQQMTNEAMLARHWKEIQTLSGQSFDADAQQFTLGTVLQPSLLSDKEKVEVLWLMCTELRFTISMCFIFY